MLSFVEAPRQIEGRSGGNSEYLICRNNGLVASASAGRIIVTRMDIDAS